MMSTASSILAAKTAPGEILGPQDMTLHCSSFSKCLVPGFRIGWVAAGKHARRIQQLQLMSTLSTSSPMQLALVDYLSTKRYDAHLRRLRRQLAERKQQAWQALLRHLPGGENPSQRQRLLFVAGTAGRG
jgi:DNA-binding transcriptional MocR family regulator